MHLKSILAGILYESIISAVSHKLSKSKSCQAHIVKSLRQGRFLGHDGTFSVRSISKRP